MLKSSDQKHILMSPRRIGFKQKIDVKLFKYNFRDGKIRKKKSKTKNEKQKIKMQDSQ